jgi:hypothetical protein
MTDPRGVESAGTEGDDQAGLSPSTLPPDAPDPTGPTRAHDALAGRDRFALDDDDETLCSLCLRRPRHGRWEWCRACLLDLRAALRRRREAELRLPPPSGGPS